MHQELAVPVAAGDRRVAPPDDVATRLAERLLHLVAHAGVDRRVGDHPVPARHLHATGLELRLHEQHHRTRRRHRPGQDGDHLGERDERQVRDDDRRGRRGRRQVGGSERPDVEALDHGDTRVVAQPRVQLAVADVERDHVVRAALEQAVGEPSRGGPGVECGQPCDVDPERLERVVELVATATDETRRLAGDEHCVTGVDET